MSSFRIVDHPSILMRPRIRPPYSWAGHIPFAYLAMALIKPRVFVELGTHTGNSYLAFCQAVESHGLETKCHAVDTWEGDSHSMRYGEDVLEELKSYHDPRYSAFSSLHQKSFDQALGDFEDGSVDLLHIDGLHTYEAVRHDFESWQKKLSSRAVVLLHDTAVKEGDFGVWKYFAELSKKYPSFNFTHSNGLGVVCVGKNIPKAFFSFFDEAVKEPASVRTFFEAVATTIVDPGTGLPAGGLGETSTSLTAKLYFRGKEEEYSADRCVVLSRKHSEGELLLQFDLPRDAKIDFVRFDPSECPGVYGVVQMCLASDDDELQEISDFPSRVQSLGGDRVDAQPPAFFRFVSLNSDPFIEFDVSGIIDRCNDGMAQSLRIVALYEEMIGDMASARALSRVEAVTTGVRARARSIEHLENLVNIAAVRMIQSFDSHAAGQDERINALESKVQSGWGAASVALDTISSGIATLSATAHEGFSRQSQAGGTLSTDMAALSSALREGFSRQDMSGDSLSSDMAALSLAIREGFSRQDLTGSEWRMAASAFHERLLELDRQFEGVEQGVASLDGRMDRAGLGMDALDESFRQASDAMRSLSDELKQGFDEIRGGASGMQGSLEARMSESGAAQAELLQAVREIGDLVAKLHERMDRRNPRFILRGLFGKSHD